ncbi:MAG: hypothetical protein LBM77_13265 [Spirochaetaceae bacterium]|jgi:hypothetical protein|nr:hypothetical protein [Spirochaetaceae bacterium]
MAAQTQRKVSNEYLLKVLLVINQRLIALEKANHIEVNDELEDDNDCLLCKYYNIPNAETIASFKEGEAMERGEIPSHTFNSFEEFWASLDEDDE